MKYTKSVLKVYFLYSFFWQVLAIEKMQEPQPNLEEKVNPYLKS